MFRNMMTPQEAYEKCLNENRRIIELEEIIATDSEYSYLYARYVIKGPFKIGEEIISKDPKWSLWYAHNVIKGPFEKCHTIIFNSKYRDNYIKFLKNINYDMTEIGEWLI